MKSRFLFAAALLTVLAACSSYPKLSDAERLDLYRSHAGEPVRDFQYFGSLVGWTPVGDRAVAVWSRPNEAYMLELMAPCFDLDYAPAIHISSMMNRVSRFDSIRVLGGATGVAPISCRIDTIRPLDLKALKQAEQKLREAQIVEREAQPSGT